MRGNFGLKQQNIARNCLTYMLDFIVMQMSKGNREKSYYRMVSRIQGLGFDDIDLNLQLKVDHILLLVLAVCWSEMVLWLFHYFYRNEYITINYSTDTLKYTPH